MPGLGRTQQVVLMLLLWAAVLIGVDLKYNKHPERTVSGVSVGHPRITITLGHLCCSGCYEIVYKAIKQYSWLTKPTYLDKKSLPTHEEATRMVVPARLNPATYSGQVGADLDPTQVRLVDLMLLPKAIENEGLAPAEFKLTGIPHFVLHVTLPHLCCPTCTEAVNIMCDTSGKSAIATELAKLNAVHTVVGLDSVSLEFRDEADIAELKRVLFRVGYVPREIHIEILK